MTQNNENMNAISDEALENVAGGCYNPDKGDARLESNRTDVIKYSGFDTCPFCNEQKNAIFYQTTDGKFVCEGCLNAGKVRIAYY